MEFYFFVSNFSSKWDIESIAIAHNNCNVHVELITKSTPNRSK